MEREEIHGIFTQLSQNVLNFVSSIIDSHFSQIARNLTSKRLLIRCRSIWRSFRCFFLDKFQTERAEREFSLEISNWDRLQSPESTVQQSQLPTLMNFSIHLHVIEKVTVEDANHWGTGKLNQLKTFIWRKFSNFHSILSTAESAVYFILFHKRTNYLSTQFWSSFSFLTNEQISFFTMKNYAINKAKIAHFVTQFCFFLLLRIYFHF